METPTQQPFSTPPQHVQVPEGHSHRKLAVGILCAIALVCILIIALVTRKASRTLTPVDIQQTLDTLNESSTPVNTTAQERSQELQRLESQSKPVTLTEQQRLDEQSRLNP